MFVTTDESNSEIHYTHTQDDVAWKKSEIFTHFRDSSQKRSAGFGWYANTILDSLDDDKFPFTANKFKPTTTHWKNKIYSGNGDFRKCQFI